MAGGPHRSKAVVIGGSMAGLLAARVLSDHFEEVTVLDRDGQPDGANVRRGAPQGAHIHGLLATGRRVLEELFPGLLAALERDGAMTVDACKDFGWHHAGSWRMQVTSELKGVSMSRPLLESHVRQRVRALPKVTFAYERKVTALVGADGRVTGVKHRAVNGTNDEELLADLVVDAGGRGSQASEWLHALGYGRPDEEEVKMSVAYASRFFRRTALAPRGKVLMVTPKAPAATRMGGLFPVEGDRWICSLVGWHGDHSATDDAGFLEFARSLPVPDIYEMIRGAEPLTPVVVHKVPSNLRRRYDRMSRLPDGFVLVGDSVCSFNPTYGQGMTVSALGAMALEGWLRKRGSTIEFQKRLAKVGDVPWMLATAEDFRYPQTDGARPFGMGLLHAYTARVQDLCGRDPKVALSFYDVMHMLKTPAALFAPGIMWRVLGA